jgi:cytochrome c1
MRDSSAVRRSVGRRILVVAVGVVALTSASIASLLVVSHMRIDRKKSQVFEVLGLGFDPRLTDSVPVAERARLYEARGCADCHGVNGAGKVFMDSQPLATFRGANITPGAGGLSPDTTPADFDAAVRHGLSRARTPLMMMKAEDFTQLSDTELAALYAHVKSLAPVDVDAATEAHNVGPLGTVLIAFDKFPAFDAFVVDHNAPRPAAPPVGPTAEYGAYLAQGCKGCHGAGLAGGPLPGAPPDLPVPSNITPDATGLAGWTYAEFDSALREGLKRDGTKINEFMPVAGSLSKMTDTESQALYAHLKALPPRPFGSR